MDECCERPAEPRAEGCPACGHTGRETERITLKALLKPKALARLGPKEHHFCASPECPVVYFRNAQVFRTGDVLVPVFHKEVEGARTVCYCFGITGDQIRLEIGTSGSSPSVERIKALVHAGRCACEVRNPQGTCCLGNVGGVVRKSGAATHGVRGVLAGSAISE